MIEFSISTSWNAKYAPDASSMIKELKEMGFNKFELNFTLTSRDICDIISIRKREGIGITSLHNYCPIPEGINPNRASPDNPSLSSADDDERKMAVEATRVTIETASRLNASAVILHMGKVEIKDKTRELFATLNDKKSYKTIKEEMIEERKKVSKRYFDNASSSIEELLPSAIEHNVILGLENRFYYNEIPSLDEMKILLDRFTDRHIGYWHDTGHAQIFENIGISRHRDYLDRLSLRMVGLHLHDVEGEDDHRAPLQGKIDFSMLKPYINRETLMVLEPHQPATPQEIRKGADYLKRLFDDIR